MRVFFMRQYTIQIVTMSIVLIFLSGALCLGETCVRSNALAVMLDKELGSNARERQQERQTLRVAWRGDISEVSSLNDDELQVLGVWDESADLCVFEEYFPDGELYVRAMNADKIRGKEVIVDIDFRVKDAFLRGLFVLDILKRNGSKSVQLYIKGLDELEIQEAKDILLDIFYRAAGDACDLTTYAKDDKGVYVPVEYDLDLFENKHQPKEIGKVVVLDARMLASAENLTQRFGLKKRDIVLLSPDDPQLKKKVEKITGKNVVVVHSMSNNAMTEDLLKILPRLRMAGVETLTLALTYLSYARQDKTFLGRTGAPISAHAIAESLYEYADVIYSVTSHMAGDKVDGMKHGSIQLGNAEVYNLNGFTQLVEYSFGLIQQGLVEAYRSKKMLSGAATIENYEMREILLAEFQKRPIYIVAPDQGAALAADDAREVLQMRLWEKYKISANDLEVKVAFLKKKRFSSEVVRMAPNLFRFKRDKRNTIIFNDLHKPEGVERDIREINTNSWVFLVDDLLATGGTTKSALYILTEKIGFKPYRILTTWVHGQFSKGLASIIGPSTVSQADIIAGVRDGSLLGDSPPLTYDSAGMTNHEKEQSYPFFIATTNSYFSKEPRQNMIEIKDFMSVNLFRLFSYGIKKKTNNVRRVSVRLNASRAVKTVCQLLCDGSIEKAREACDALRDRMKADALFRDYVLYFIAQRIVEPKNQYNAVAEKVIAQEFLHIVSDLPDDAQMTETQSKYAEYLGADSVPLFFNEDSGLRKALLESFEVSEGVRSAFFASGKIRRKKYDQNNTEILRIHAAGGVSYYKNAPQMYDAYMSAIYALEYGGIAPDHLEVVCTYPYGPDLLQAEQGVFSLEWFIGANGIPAAHQKLTEKYFDVLPNGKLQVKQFVRNCIKTEVTWLEDYQHEEYFDIVLYKDTEYKVELFSNREGRDREEFVRTNKVVAQLTRNLKINGLLLSTGSKWIDLSYYLRKARNGEDEVIAFSDEFTIHQETIPTMVQAFRKMSIPDSRKYLKRMFFRMFGRVLDRDAAWLLPHERNEMLWIASWAYDFAAEIHKDDDRENGEPYLYHPVMAAWILLEKLRCGEFVSKICVGKSSINSWKQTDYSLVVLAAVMLLHDTVEDHGSLVTKEYMSQHFMKRLGQVMVLTPEMKERMFETIWQGVYHLDKKNATLQQLAHSEDVWHALIKVADTLQNILSPRYEWTMGEAVAYLKTQRNKLWKNIPEHDSRFAVFFDEAEKMVDIHFTPEYLKIKHQKKTLSGGLPLDCLSGVSA